MHQSKFNLSYLQQIQQLDPIKDHSRIYYLMTGYEFPWEMNRAFEVALLRTFCIPQISRILYRTGEFSLRGQKRYDDTAIIIAELACWGYDSDRGQAVIRRMNQMHRQFDIPNEDFLYVLSTVIYEPIHWNDRFGWRKMCEQEKLAAFYFWQQVGRRMGIQQIPETYTEFEQFKHDYEQKYMHYSETNIHLAQAVCKLIQSWFPAWLRPLVRAGFPALLDQQVLAAFQLPAANPVLREMIWSALRLRTLLLHLLPPRQQHALLTHQPHRSYPDGYQLSQIGLDTTAEKGDRLSRCPMHRLIRSLKQTS